VAVVTAVTVDHVTVSAEPRAPMGASICTWLKFSSWARAEVELAR
jgi:hypothetical protein